MNNDFYYLLTLTEILGLLLLIVFVYNLLLRKDKVNLVAYVIVLKDKIKSLKLKLAESNNQPEILKKLLLDTIEHIKISYQEKYQHELGTPPPETNADDEARINNTKDHFIYVLGYQSLKAELTALENSNSPQNTWEKIEASLSALVNNFRVIIPENFHQPIEDDEKPIEQTQSPDRIKKLLEDTIEHIKETYQNKFGHELGQGGTSTEENNSKEHFLHILGYQGLKAQLTAFENSNTAEKTWVKIAAQLSSLIENFRIMPEKEFETIIEERIQEYIITKESKNQSNQIVSPAAIKTNKNNKASVNGDSTAEDQFILERKNEIDRLKRQVSSQFEDIWKLQNELTNKLASSEGTDNDNELLKQIESITRQIKDSELCISMMDADIVSQEEEISSLKQQLEKAPASESNEEIAQKDELIASFSRDSKEMLTAIEGMEKNEDELIQRISDLEIIEAQLKEIIEQKEAQLIEHEAVIEESDTNNISQDDIDKREKIISRFAQESKEMLMLIDGLEREGDTHKQKIKELENIEIELHNIISKNNAGPAQNTQEDIKKKDKMINDLTQNNKEMLTLIDGMEKNDDENYERIKKLESELEKLKKKTKRKTNKPINKTL